MAIERGLEAEIKRVVGASMSAEAYGNTGFPVLGTPALIGLCEEAGIKAGDPRPEFMFAEAARADTGIDPRMPIPMDKLEWLQQQLVKAGNLSQPFDVSRVVNGDIRAQALARAGLPR